MIPLILGMALFVGMHLFPAQPLVRNGLIRRFGAGAYKGVFSAVSLAGLALIVLGYHKAQIMPGKNPILWTPPAWGRHVTMTLMLPVFPLLIATYLPGRLARLVRHPMITAVMLWAAAHLFMRGDAASLLMFGGFLAWAIYDRLSLHEGEKAGRAREKAGEVTVKGGAIVNDIIALVGGLALYAVMLKWGHAYLIGVRLIP